MSDLTLRRSIAALVVWVLLGALGAGAAALVADDITGTLAVEGQTIHGQDQQAGGTRFGTIPDMAIMSRPVGSGLE